MDWLPLHPPDKIDELGNEICSTQAYPTVICKTTNSASVVPDCTSGAACLELLLGRCWLRAREACRRLSRRIACLHNDKIDSNSGRTVCEDAVMREMVVCSVLRRVKRLWAVQANPNKM